MRIPAFRTLLVCALVTLTPPALAAGAVDERLDGPAVGTRVGALVAAADQAGAARDFRSLRGKKGLILLFSRSFDW
ncbi:MAG: hypothetical protein OYH76_15195 [Defluviicoccus sp.]|nr:hypothetical protein [Defluviicoccus sp.]MDE0277239.1 hypothetical protein [Defluviicoccus sp.]